MTAIIILNWNGYKDTIECLDSLLNCQNDFFIVVVDNGSDNNSVEFIKKHLEEHNTSVDFVKYGDTLNYIPRNHQVIIYPTNRNLGFARGNNEALRMLSKLDISNYLLLNNDTIVEEHFLDKLLSFQETHPQYEVLTPLICFESNRNIIWNAGGKLFCGLRKYYYDNKHSSCVKEHLYKDITFITGCALFFTPSILRKDGGIFIEDFFFGEEDFNFSLTMKKNKRKMACVVNSLIYHKVGASTAQKFIKGKLYIHYLNRFIDIKRNYSFVFYTLWKYINALYILTLLTKKGCSFTESMTFIKNVINNAKHKNKVTHEDFIKAIENIK